MLYDQGQRAFIELSRGVENLKAYPPMKALLLKRIDEIHSSVEESSFFLACDLPWAVAELEGLGEEIALSAMTASLSLWIGADLMDDAADGDLRPSWEQISQGQLSLLVSNLLFTLPLLAGSPQLGGSLAEALWEMSSGQFQDLSLETKAGEYLEMIRQKSGRELGFFARAPVLLAGLSEERQLAWQEFGVALGSMLQAFSDIEDCFGEQPSRDLPKRQGLPFLMMCDALEQAQLQRARADFDSRLERLAQGEFAIEEQLLEEMINMEVPTACFQLGALLRFRTARAFPLDMNHIPRNHPIRVLMGAFSN